MGVAEWAKGKWEKGKRAASEGREDMKEIWNLEKDFIHLSDARQYLKDHKDELEDIDVIDVFRKPATVEQKIVDANTAIAKALASTQRICETNLRFSQDYLGETIGEIESALKELNGFTANLLEDIVNPSTYTGKAAKKVLSDEKMRELASLSVKIKELKGNTQSLQETLQSLVDPKLKEHSNNKLLNPLLKAKGTYDRLKEIVETLQKLKRMKDRITSLGLGD